MDALPQIPILITPAQEGWRLDKALAETLDTLSRARIQALIAQGQVARVGPGGDRQPALKPTAKVRAGEAYALILPPPSPMTLQPAAIALNIVFEDDDLLVLNKPAGMTVHPAAGTGEDTLVHALLAHCGDSLSGIGGVARPGIVHRLDKDTSGLIAVAKHDGAHQSLAAQLKARTLSRVYLAFAWGEPPAGLEVVDAPIARHPRHRKQMAVVEGGRAARTHIAVEQRYRAPGSIRPLASRIRATLETGRTHQIRVHLQHVGCGLIGDPRYGAPTSVRLQRLAHSGMAIAPALAGALTLVYRQALHAAQLSLTHPKTGEKLTFSCPLPDDLQALENALAALTN